MKKLRFKITGMSCAACAAHVEKSVEKLGAQAEVSLLTESMDVTCPDELTPDKVIAAVTAAGYGAAPLDDDAPADTSAVEDTAPMKRRITLSFIFLIALMYFSMGHMIGLPLPSALTGPRLAVVQLILTLPVVLLNRKYFSSGMKSLFLGAPNMDTLIATGSGAALIYGIYATVRIFLAQRAGDAGLVHEFSMQLYFESAAMILTLVTLGKYLEAGSRKKTGDAIRALMDLAPKVATVKRGELETAIPVSALKPGDICTVRPGQSIPADGTVSVGGSTVDESALTGESVPREKAQGDNVFAGTVNRAGYMEFTVEKTAGDTTLFEMIRLVERAASGKAPIQKLADKVAAVFVPVVMGIALIAAAAWLIAGYGLEFALSTGISVLVISCPCALGLATPVAIMAGTGAGAKNNILIRSADSLQQLASVKTLVMDKTGTLTTGVMRVVQTVSCDMTESELISVAASLEKLSEHPVGQAITARAEEDSGIQLQPVQDFSYIPGRGVSGTVNGIPCLAGSEKLLSERKIPVDKLADEAARLAAMGRTVIYVSAGKKVGLIAVMDAPRESARSAVKALKKLNIAPVMLTGDGAATAMAVAAELGIENVHAGVLPTDKEAVVAELMKTGSTAMLGDGINDSPALARADVGIAVGGGTDIAKLSADIILTRSDPYDAVTAVRLSRRVMLTVKENLFWAFFYNCIGIPLAAGVLYLAAGVRLSPMIAAAAMSLSSVTVVLNALRLKLFKADKTEYNMSEKENVKGDDTLRTILNIEGMMCAHCAGRVEQALTPFGRVEVQLENKRAVIESEKAPDVSALRAAVEAAGYTVTNVDGE